MYICMILNKIAKFCFLYLLAGCLPFLLQSCPWQVSIQKLMLPLLLQRTYLEVTDPFVHYLKTVCGNGLPGKSMGTPEMNEAQENIDLFF